MDFSVLSRYDDILADYFVDSLYLWYNTLRMNGDFVGTKVDKQQIVSRLREHVVKNPQTQTAVKVGAESFLSLPYFQEYTKDFNSKQMTEFTQHMKRYLLMYRANAGFEVGSTTRYTGKPEACIIATKDWEAGEQVTCCVGSIAALSEQDDLKLKSEGRDFSVMVSTRKKCSCLFLGPARFMNHDCDSNCEFILIGQNSITFRVIKDISIGEEMTVFYADHYFGEDNCECLCCSCERLQQGHFSPAKENDTTPNESDAEQAVTSTENNRSRRSGRKRKEISYKDYYVPDQVKRGRTASSDLVTGTNSKALHKITNTEQTKKKSELTNQHNIIDGNIVKPITATTVTRSFRNNSLNDILSEPGRQRFFVDARANHRFKRAASAPAKINYRGHSQYQPLLSQNVSLLNPVQFYNGRVQHDDLQHDKQLEAFKDWLDDISDVSDVEAPNADDCQLLSRRNSELSCCANWKEYRMTRASEEPSLCGRCNRHYQIYGIHWPIRKIRKPCGRAKPKGTIKMDSPKLLLPPPIPPVEEVNPSPTPSKTKDRAILHEIAPRIRHKGNRLKGKTSFKVDQKPIIPSAASYDNDPIIISAWPTNLSIPIIHTKNIPMCCKNVEKSLLINAQDRLIISRPSKRIPNTPYQPICLNSDMRDCRNQLIELQEKRDNLIQLRNRLYQVIYSQNNERTGSVEMDDTTSRQHLEEFTSSDAYPTSPAMNDIDTPTDIDTVQNADCNSQATLEVNVVDDYVILEESNLSSDYIDIEYYDDENYHTFDSIPVLDGHTDTDSPISITTPSSMIIPEDSKCNNEDISKQSENISFKLPADITMDDNHHDEDCPTVDAQEVDLSNIVDDVIDIENVENFEPLIVQVVNEVKTKECVESAVVAEVNNAVDEYKNDKLTVSSPIQPCASSPTQTQNEEKCEDNSNLMVASTITDDSVDHEDSQDAAVSVFVNESTEIENTNCSSTSVDQRVSSSSTRNTSNIEFEEGANVIKASIRIVDNEQSFEKSLSEGGIVNKHGEIPSPIHQGTCAPDLVQTSDSKEPSEDVKQTQEPCSPDNVHSPINDAPSPTFTEILEYAVSPVITSQNPSFAQCNTAQSESKTIVKDELLNEALFPVDCLSAMDHQQSEVALMTKRAKEPNPENNDSTEISKLFSIASEEATNKEKTDDTMDSLELGIGKTAKRRRKATEFRIISVDTTTLPDLTNSLRKPPAMEYTPTEFQASIDFLSIVSGPLPKEAMSSMTHRSYFSSILGSELQDHYSYSNIDTITSPALEEEQLVDNYSPYYPPRSSTESSTNFPQQSDEECSSGNSVPSFETIVGQNSFEQNSSNAIYSSSAIEYCFDVKKEYNEEELTNALRRATKYNTANQENNRTHETQLEEIERVKREEYQQYSLPSFQDIISQNHPRTYIYHLGNRHQPNLETARIPSLLGISNLLSQEKMANISAPCQMAPLPDFSTINQERAPSNADSICGSNSQSKSDDSHIHTNRRNESTRQSSPSPIPQQPPMKVSFILQSQDDAKESNKLKTKNTPKEVQKKKATTQKQQCKKPEATKPRTRTATSNTRQTRSKKKSQVACPITPPQREPMLSPSKTVRPTIKNKYNGYDPLNPPVPRHTPTPLASSRKSNGSVNLNNCDTENDISPFLPIEPNC